MLTTYGNWSYADEDPLAKRRKTTKGDTTITKEQTGSTTNSNDMTYPKKPLLVVRKLIGDRLSKPKNRSENSNQNGNVFLRETNNPCCIQRYSVPNPAVVFGVRDIRNSWPGRVQIPNREPRFEYRSPIIARPYPLRVRPAFSSFPVNLAHKGYVRASVTSAFSPVRLKSSEYQSSIFTTPPVRTAYSSSIQSLRQLVCSVTAADSTSTEAPPHRITSSELSKCRDFETIAQPMSTTPPSPIQPKISPKFQSSHTPVQTYMYSPPVLDSPEPLNIKPTIQSNTTTPPSSIQSQESPKFQSSRIPVQTINYSPSTSVKVESQTPSLTTTNTTVTTSSPEGHYANSDFSTVRSRSSGSPKFQNSRSIGQSNQPFTQSQQTSTFQPSHIPVQTIMYSPPSSLRTSNQSFCPVTTTIATSSVDEELSLNSAIMTSPGSSVSQSSVVTAQSVIQTQESSKFQSSHIPVQTIVYSSSFRASNSTFCSVTTNTTTTVTSSSIEELSANSEFTSGRIMSSRLSKSQVLKSTARGNMTAAHPQESTKLQPGHIPVHTIMYSPPTSRQTADNSFSSVTTSSAENVFTNSDFSDARVMSTASSTFQTSIVTTRPVMTAHSSSKSSSVGSSSTASLTEELIESSASVRPQGSSNSQTSKLTTHLLLLSPPASRKSSESSTTQIPKPKSQPPTVPPSSSVQSSETTTTPVPKITTRLLLLSPSTSVQSSEPSTTQTSKSTTQSITTPPSSIQSSASSTRTSSPTTHLLLLSPPQRLKPTEQSQSQFPELTKLLLISPPGSTTTTPTTTSPVVVSSSIGGESLSETTLDLDETVVHSVVGAIKVNIPDTSETAIKRKEDEIEEKDALLQRIYSVPAFGGKSVKNAKLFEEMLTKTKLCHLFKCMASDCSFTCNQKTSFDEHIEMHESQDESQKESSKIQSEEDGDCYDWQQCAYCCESPVYPASSLSEHLIAEHGYCAYQCAYCFYRAMFQNYVDIHQTIAHRKILKSNPRVVYRCKAVSKGPTVANALKKIGRRRCVRPYHCDQCGREFLITEEFMNHLLKEHQSVTTYTCHICKNVCFKPDRLVVHYKLHSYSTYQCAYCLHGTETERKMIFHLCTIHFAQPACLYVRAWEEGKQVQVEDKSKKVRNRGKFTNQLESLKMIAYDIEAIKGQCTLEEVSDEESVDDDRLVIDESQELNDIIAELGITTETEPSEGIPLAKGFVSIGNSTAQNISVSTLLPNAKFSLEGESGGETVLISSGLSSNSSSI